MERIAPQLTVIFIECLRLSYHPYEWKRAITITLKKLKKEKYDNPKAYRLIALLNTYSKLLESIVARRLS